MVTYKNIFPRDFSQLQYGSGFIYSILNDKQGAYKQEKSKINSEISTLESELEALKSSHKASFEVLKETHLKTEGILVDGKSENTYPTRMAYVRDVLKGEKLSIVQLNQYRYQDTYRKSSVTVSLDTLLKNMEATAEYQKDKKIVEDIQNGKKETIAAKIQDLKIKRKQVEGQPFSKVFDDNQFGRKLEEHTDIKNNDYYDLIIFYF